MEAVEAMDGLQRRAASVGVSSAAFDQFYRATWPDVVAYCAGLLGDRAAGEEAAQEAFVRVYPRWSRLDDPRPYVFRVANNLCTRHRWLRRRVLPHGLQPAEESSASHDLYRLVVGDALRSLPLKLRAVLLLHYYADLSVAEIAQVLGRPSGTVKRQLHDARAAVAAIMPDPRLEGHRDGSD